MLAIGVALDVLREFTLAKIPTELHTDQLCTFSGIEFLRGRGASSSNDRSRRHHLQNSVDTQPHHR